MAESKRIAELDIIKALCIIFMVIGHTSWKYMSIFLLFHMAVFFMVSGWLFKDKYACSFNSLIVFTFKRIKRLYITWLIVQTIFLLCNNLFLEMGLLTDDPEFLNSQVVKNLFGLSHSMGALDIVKEEIKIIFMLGGTQFGGSLWFLRALLLVEVLHCVIVYLSNKVNKYLCPVLVFILFVFGRILYGFNFGRVDLIRIVLLQVTIPLSAYYIGTLCKRYNQYLAPIYSWIGLIISMVVLLILNYLGVHNDMSNGTMTNVAGYIIATLSGFVFCMSVAKQLLKCKFISKSLVYIGQNTMAILVLHLLIFKIVTYVQIILYKDTMDLPSFALASFPNLLSFGAWPYIYTFVGITGSLMLNKLYKYLKIKLFRAE